MTDKSNLPAKAQSRAAVKQLLQRFPVSPRDRAWRPDEVLVAAFEAAERMFEKHLKDKIKETN